MNETVAKEWLKAAYDDILVMEKIHNESNLTHMTAFHAQQCIEKSLKSILEFNEKKVPRKHDLLTLKDHVQPYIYIENEDLLDDLNDLYIESRYPGSFGLLPSGKPTIKEAEYFYVFAKNIFNDVCKLLKIEILS